jgi:hypothetical protein
MILQEKIWIVHFLIDVLISVDRVNLLSLNLFLSFWSTSNDSILLVIFYIQNVRSTITRLLRNELLN